jgi:phage baseplate assembly protein gpV
MAGSDIQITPFQLSELYELRITSKVNDHTRLFLRGKLWDGSRDQYLNYVTDLDEDSKVVVNYGKGNAPDNLFNGILANIKVTSDGLNTYLEAEGISSTFNLDIKLEKKSFQNLEKTYDKLLEKYGQTYNVEIINTAAKEATFSEFALQYNETDWQFLKRLASRYWEGLVPDTRHSKPAFYFGFPPETDGQEVKVAELDLLYCHSGRKLIINPDCEESRTELLYYEIETHRHLHIGDTVIFDDGRKLVIFEATAELLGNNVKYTYALAQRDSLIQYPFGNPQIVGLSIGGKVLGIEHDYLRLSLDLDDETPTEQESTPFPCATLHTAAGNTGWYWMPEIGERVKLYFPNIMEGSGFVLAAERELGLPGGKTDQPNVKYFRTKTGKELMFSDDEVLITAEGLEDKKNVVKAMIRLHGKNGLQMTTTKTITLKTPKKLELKADGNLTISAKESIKAVCKDSSLVMNGDTSIKGKKVKN